MFYCDTSCYLSWSIWTVIWILSIITPGKEAPSIVEKNSNVTFWDFMASRTWISSLSSQIYCIIQWDTVFCGEQHLSQHTRLLLSLSTPHWTDLFIKHTQITMGHLHTSGDEDSSFAIRRTQRFFFSSATARGNA